MIEKHEGVGTQTHYTAHAIEPIDYIVENKLDFLEGNVIKYVTRYKLKNGVEDLKKARQYLDWLIEREGNLKEEMSPFAKEEGISPMDYMRRMEHKDHDGANHRPG